MQRVDWKNQSTWVDIESGFDYDWASTLGIQVLKSRETSTKDVSYMIQPAIMVVGQSLPVIKLRNVSDPLRLLKWCVDQWGDPGTLWGSLSYHWPRFSSGELIWFRGSEELAAWTLTWNE